MRRDRAKPARRTGAKPQRRKVRDPLSGPSDLGPKACPAKLGDTERSTLKAKIKLRRKYRNKKLADFRTWPEIQEKFLYDHQLIYREDRRIRNDLMKCISDTANTYMRIRKALGLKEYDWTDNPHFFLHMGLCKRLWRKGLERLVGELLPLRLTRDIYADDPVGPPFARKRSG